MREEALIPVVQFRNCPIRTTLGVLGKKWTMLILRDIGFLKINRFNEILRSLPGLTPRILSVRLKQLERDGIIERTETQRTPRLVKWGLTRMGRDTMPILMSFIAFGSRWFPEVIFGDKRARTPEELFPDRVKFSTVIKNV